GTGAFTFTPQTGVVYELKIETPAGIEGRHRIPDAKPEGVTLHIPAGVTTSLEPLPVFVHNVGAERRLLVGAYCRGRLLDHRVIHAKAAERTETRLVPAGSVAGVYRVTVFEDRAEAGQPSQFVPAAERLVYRSAAERLNLAVLPDKQRYAPGQRVSLSFSARNEKGRPADAIVMVAAVDKSVLTLADEKTARSMPTHFLLTTEVRKPEDLEHADFLLGTHPRALEAVDLLLGTQGWRRFAEQAPERFRQQHADDAGRLLAAMGETPVRTTNEREVERSAQPEFGQALQRAEAQFSAEERAIKEDLGRALNRME